MGWLWFRLFSCLSWVGCEVTPFWSGLFVFLVVWFLCGGGVEWSGVELSEMEVCW